MILSEKASATPVNWHECIVMVELKCHVTILCCILVQLSFFLYMWCIKIFDIIVKF